MHRRVLAGLALALTLTAPAAVLAQAQKPLYRDPVFDGAADVAIAWDKTDKLWRMFYTNRRATLKLEDPKDVAWLHATAIGVATSKDGLAWTYAGTANIPAACTGETLWAPEIFTENGVHHMFLTVVPGIFHRWNLPEAGAKIVHLTSTDLKAWTCADTLALGSDRVIDAGVIKAPQGGYRMWFKDERKDSRIFFADSPDLKSWTRQPAFVADFAGEGPKVFFFKGAWWMIADAWKGLAVLRSKDAVTWERQPGFILDKPGSQTTDRDLGHHPDVVVNDGRALLYYFVGQGKEDEAKADPVWNQRTVIQLGELQVGKDGWLTIDREAAVKKGLKAPRH